MPKAPAKPGFSGLQLMLIVLVTIAVTVGGTFFIVRFYIFPSEFEPVTLSAREEQLLDRKLRRLGWTRQTPRDNARNARPPEPEAYTESDDNREITLSEKELNALLAGNADYARRVAIDLADDLASANILMPVPDDFPVMAGRMLRVNAGFGVRLSSTGRPIIALRGVSIMGVPIPNAWLGNLKNVDLVSEFGDRGFWKAFADGVRELEIRDGELYVRLRE